MKRMNGFKASRAGNVALMFALTAPLLLLAGGGVIDLGHFLLRKTQIQDAADAAALGSVAKSSDAYATGVLLSAGGVIPSADPQLQAQQIFNADKPNIGDTSIGLLTWSGSRSATAVSDAVQVSASFRTDFLRLIGVPTLPLQVASSASSGIPPFVDFYMLLDNSPSMGVGASTNDITNLISLTANKTDGNSKNCAFACHELDKPAPGTPGATANAIDNYWTAKQNGVQTRIDVVRAATQALTSTATSTAVSDGVPCQFRMAIYTFGATADANGLTPVIQTPSNNLQSASTTQTCTGHSGDPSVYDKATAVDLMTSLVPGDNNDDDTVFTSVMGGLVAGGTPGPYAISKPLANAGATPTNPQKVVFFVSDGMTDAPNGQGGGRPANTTFGGIDQAACTNLKNNGILVAVLYTTYLPLPTNSFFNSNIAKYVNAPSQVATAMNNCASPGLYFEVQINQDITAAMNTLFQRVVSVVKINS